MTAVVFLGPTLAIDDARRVLDAVYLPPARQADVLSAVVQYRPRVLAVVDGLFFQSLSVWHKEVLYALSRGVRVFGSSSIGALRAAELAPFGMVGIGRVFEMYERGELADDADVALAHTDAEDGYRKLSEPLVNVLHTLRRAARDGIVGEHDLALLESVARAIYFPERTVARILAESRRAGLPAATADALEQVFATQYVDVKREDALELLRAVSVAEADGDASQAPTLGFESTVLFVGMRDRDRVVEHDEVRLALGDVVAHAALHNPEFGDLNRDGLNRALAQVLATVVGLDVPEREVDEQVRRFRRRAGLATDEELARWMTDNDLTAEEFRDLMRELATCHVLHLWLLRAQAVPSLGRIALDEARLKGQYPRWAVGAAEQASLLQAQHLAGDLDERLTRLTTSRLVEEHLAATECLMDTDHSRWSLEAGFLHPDDFRTELLRAALARRAVERLHRLVLGEYPPSADAGT